MKGNNFSLRRDSAPDEARGEDTPGGARGSFIFTMIRLMPGTFTLTLASIAPIIASMLLLIGSVVVLLLWQQLQLKEKR